MFSTVEQIFFTASSIPVIPFYRDSRVVVLRYQFDNSGVTLRRKKDEGLPRRQPFLVS